MEVKVFSSFWLGAWAMALCLGWLLPNHYPPWSSFHMEAWVAGLLLAAGVAVILRTPRLTAWYGLTLTVVATAFLPLFQYAFGMYAFSGPAWVATAYLVGFAFALLVGVRWESATKGQPADGLFLAFGIAAVVSVGLQLHQWVRLDRLFLWDMGNETGRPFANFGQSNLCATFLLWATLGIAWGIQRKKIGVGAGLVLVLYFIFGVALTGSRTAWIAVALLVAAAWLWRHLWPSKWVAWVVTGLGLYFWGCIFVRGWVRDWLMLGAVEDLTRVTGESRPTVWRFFLDAALSRPLFGYGWNQIGIAHTAEADSHPALGMFFSHAHNLFIDLLLWCGIPLGLLLGFILLRWLWLRLKAVHSAEDALLLMVVLVVANHALFEFPLHHAFFLLPLGIIIGMLDVRLASPMFQQRGRWSVVLLCVLSTLALTLMVRDYFRVESNFLAFRFEQARIKTPGPKEPPDVVILTDLRDLIKYLRYEPHKGMTPEELRWMTNVAELYPGAGIIHKLATAMVWNDRPDEASLWLRRMCKMVHPLECEAVRNAWLNQAAYDEQIRAVPFP